MLRESGSRSIYVDRFWRQVLRKYLQVTQGGPELCFGGFSTCKQTLHQHQPPNLATKSFYLYRCGYCQL